jgi:hypothetical protein
MGNLNAIMLLRNGHDRLTSLLENKETFPSVSYNMPTGYWANKQLLARMIFRIVERGTRVFITDILHAGVQSMRALFGSILLRQISALAGSGTDENIVSEFAKGASLSAKQTAKKAISYATYYTRQPPPSHHGVSPGQ